MTATLARLRQPLAASFVALAIACPAMAQTDRSAWVDPPARADAPAQPSPAPSTQAPGSPPVNPQPKAEAQPSAPAPKVQTAKPSEPAPSAAPASTESRADPAEPKAAPAPKPAAKPTLTFSEPEAPPRARSVRRPRAAPSPEPEVAARPQPQGRERQARTETDAARQLAIDYLGYWSGPNPVAVGATPDFYAPRVLFHGRVMGMRALTDEKRRFTQRWPQRYYTPRIETMRTTCDLAREICTVRTLLDFNALNPASGAQSRGTANLELGVSFASGRPRIVFESSHVLRRGRSARSAALHDVE